MQCAEVLYVQIRLEIHFTSEVKLERKHENNFLEQFFFTFIVLFFLKEALSQNIQKKITPSLQDPGFVFNFYFP